MQTAAVRRVRFGVASWLSVALVATVLVVPFGRVRPAAADPVVVPLTCAAVDGMTATGSITFPNPLPVLPPIELPIGPALQPVVDQVADTELPIPMPMDLDATTAIDPGGSVQLAGSVELDLSGAVTPVVELIEAGLVEAGYPEVAASLAFNASFESLEVPFPHPPGTTPEGTPVAGGEGVTARHEAGATIVGLDEFTVHAEGATALEVDVAWSLRDGGAPGPRTLTHTLGTVAFDLDVSFGATVPKELITPIVEATFPDYAALFEALAPAQLPVTGGATGGWACTPDDPGAALATTSVTAPAPVDEPCTSPFSDVAGDDSADPHPFCAAIAWGAGEGIVQGWPDGTFRPTATVSRQAFAAFLHRAAGSPAVAPGPPSFPDLPAGEFGAAIEWLVAEGIADGYADGTFRPTAPLSRQAIAAMLHRHAGEPVPDPGAPTFPDVPAGPVAHPFHGPISWLAQEGITTGYDDGRFRPAAPITRQSLVAMLHRYLRPGA